MKSFQTENVNYLTQQCYVVMSVGVWMGQQCYVVISVGVWMGQTLHFGRFEQTKLLDKGALVDYRSTAYAPRGGVSVCVCVCVCVRNGRC